MEGLMQDFPLTLPVLVRRAEKLFGGRSITTGTVSGFDRTDYATMADRVRRLAGALDGIGLSADARVGTFAWNTARHLELYFGAPCSGRVVHTLNIRLFPEQLRWIVNHAEDEAIFVDRSLLRVLWPLLPSMRTVRHIVVMDDAAPAPAAPGEVSRGGAAGGGAPGGASQPPGDPPGLWEDPRVVDYEELLSSSSPVELRVDDENRAAAMCYTSGTTGNPKGVVYSHRSTVLHTMIGMMADTIGLSQADTLMPVVPMFHANAWGLAHGAVMAGASLVLPGPRMTPAALAEMIETEHVTVAAGVPTIWMGVLPELKGRDTSSLRLIPCGGSAVPKSLSEAYREQIGLPILQAWGMTETHPVASMCSIRAELRGLPEEELAEVRTSQGIEVPLVELRVVEPGTENELAWDGESSGELQARGPWVARSYYNDPGADDCFTKDGWLRTGDVASIRPDGYIRIVDRTKDLIKSGGEWISSVELENEIMSHPKVKEAAVIAIPSERYMERPLACVVVREGEHLTKEELLDYLRPRVAKWWLPDEVAFIGEVPKTSVGKFSKKQLRDRFADGSLELA
ncbi:MAG: long-chain fatty acid--CoA ligase [Acidimicrobiales bacterium]